jgi:ABC-type transport system involved in multi-copper enzyme maturation permease subunit
MLKTIIAKEFLNNILNLRFMVGLVLCVIITITCIIILSHDYRQELADYNFRVNLNEQALSKYYCINLGMLIVKQKPPERFRPLIIAISGKMNANSFDDSPLPTLFPPLDFLFIVTIIMSLLAILFSYDAITGERQSGTLRLMVANSVSRVKILLGKFIGGTASLLIPFILSILVGALYISIHPSIQWDVSAWLEFDLLTAASITFITLFYLLGLMVSSFSRYSFTSILICLFLWVLLILVIPNLCPYISAQLYRIPSTKEVEKKELEIEKYSIQVFAERNRETAKTFKSRYGELWSEFEAMDLGGIGGLGGGRRINKPEHIKARQRAAEDPQFKAMMDAYVVEVEKAREEMGRIRVEGGKFREELEEKAAFQTNLAKNLACISPLANFLYVARDLTGTGMRSLEHFKLMKKEYNKQYWPYVEKKFKTLQKKDPTATYYSFLDISDRPRFVFKEEPLKDKLTAVLPYWGILIMFNIAFFAAAFVGFIRYDVR